MARLSYIKHVVPEEAILTERVKRLKEATRSGLPYGDWERDHIYTEYWRASDGEPIYIRRAKAYEKVQTERTIKIFDGELIVGGISQFVIGAPFYPERHQKWIKKEWNSFKEREGDKFIPPLEKEEQVLNDLAFWEGKSIEDLGKQAWHRVGLDIVNDMIEENLTFPITALPHAGRKIVDFPKVLKKGMKGIIEEIEEMKKMTPPAAEDYYKHEFWNGCIITCNAVIKSARRYAQLAREISGKETDQKRRRELEKIAEVCERVPEHPPRTFYEALQSVYFTHAAVEMENSAYGYSFGRLDQYLYPFYKKDIEEGIITQSEAAELIACAWLKISAIYFTTSSSAVALSQTSNYQNVTIGGRDRNGRDASNELSHLIVEVDTALKLRQPTVSLRYHDTADEEILLKVGEDIATGGGKPAIFGENYAYSVLPLYGMSREEVADWAPAGCVEMGIPGCSVHYGAYFISLPHCLEMVFTNGIHRRSGKKLGIDTGKVENFSTFDQFVDALFQQYEYVIGRLAPADAIMEVGIPRDYAPVMLESTLISDCVAKGKDLHRHGARYTNSIGNNTIGMVTTANSLYAVKKLVYDDKVVTMKELAEALAADFQGDGYGRIRKLCMDAPKYGNDIDEVDDILRDLFRRCNESAVKQKNAFGEPIAPLYLGILAHYSHGSCCGATPDGRPGYTPFADGSLSAYPGTDTQGPTALIRSAVKINPSPALATIFNMKFHPALFEKPEGMRKFWDLVKTYCDLGGYHIQFNVVDRQALIDAKAHPENYRDLLVRVAGFSVYFVDLSPVVQDEIIARTEHAF